MDVGFAGQWPVWRRTGEGSVAARSRRRAALFVTLWALLQALKVVLMTRLALLPDEAFYAWEGRHPAWGYSDLPPLTALLTRLGQALLGPGAVGVRFPFFILGAMLPWLVVAYARLIGGRRIGWSAGLLALALPMLATLGVLALPDVPLTAFALVALIALERAARNGRWRDWLLLGTALALAAFTHYRAGMFALAGLAFALLTPRGRRLWRQPGWYAALALGLIATLIVVGWNLHHHWQALDFQLVQRNPWHFQPRALVQPLEQAAVVTPLLYGLLLWSLARALRRMRRGAPWDLAAIAATTLLGGYFVFGLFADDQHFRLHWPLPGYLPLLPLLARDAAALWRRGRVVARTFLTATFALAGAGLLVLLAWFALAGSPALATDWSYSKLFPNVFLGWRQVAARTGELLRDGHGSRPLLVTDHYAMAAELELLLQPRRPAWTLDNPLNAYHGRAPQLADWGRDERGLRRDHPGAAVLLVVEESALKEREQPAWLQSICRRLADLKPLGRLDLYRGEKRYSFWSARVPVRPLPAVAGAACPVWQSAHAAYLRAEAARKP